MPHTNHSSHTSSSGDDLGSTDEVKVFKDEGDREDEKISSENLLEEKSSLIDLTESEDSTVKGSSRPDHSPIYGKIESHNHTSSFNMGYLVSPYSYANGTPGGLPVSMAKGLSPFFCHNGDHLATPPPAHCGIPPPYQLDPKAIGLSRPSIYPFSPSQYPYPLLSPDMSQVASWHTPSLYSPTSGFRSPYSSSLPINTTLSSDFYRFSPTNILPSVHSHHVLNSHSSIIGSGPKQDSGQDSNHRYGRSNSDQKNSSSAISSDGKNSIDNEKKKPHIKKPLNAFMLYMKEMRAKVVAECTLKESAAINQILGRKWHSLSREEQSVYYEKARQERQLHMELYPGWSARDNYGYGSKKKKRKKDRSPADSGGNNMKKCRARYGLDQQNQWCKPCRRKKKCIRYKEADNEESGVDMDNRDDNLGSCGSVDEAKTPDDDSESLNQSLSSPGCLSGLSSLQSPSTSLASPLNLLASPATPTTFNDHQALEQTMNHLNNLRKSAASHSSSSNNINNNNNNASSIENGSTFDEHNRDTSSSSVEDKCRTSNSSRAVSSAAMSSSQLTTTTTASSASLCTGGTTIPVGSGGGGGSSHASSSAINVPEKHNPPDFYDRLGGIIKPPHGSSSSSVSANPRDISNPQHPQHPLNINQLTRRDFSSNGSPIFQRKGYHPPLHPPPPASMVSTSPALSPLMPSFSSSPPNQYHLHRQFLENNHFSAAAAAAAARHTALQSLHLQSALGAAAAHNAALSAASANLPRPSSGSGNSTATTTSHRPSDSADKGAISVT